MWNPFQSISIRTSVTLGIMCIMASTLLLVLTSVGGIGRQGTFGTGDYAYFAAAGTAWNTGQTPYNHDELQQACTLFYHGTPHEAPPLTSAFAYPPNIYPYTLLASEPSHQTALVLTGALNLLAAIALGASAFMLFRLLTKSEADRPLSLLLAFVAASLILVSPFSSHNIWMSQTSLLATALFVLGWMIAHSGYTWIGCAVLSLGFFKPNLGLVLAPIALIRWPKQFLIASLCTGMACAAYPFIRQGPILSVTDWLHAASEYVNAKQNTLTFRHTFGMKSLFAQLELNPALAYAMLAPIFMLLYTNRKRLQAHDALAIALFIPVLFVKAHDYDLVAASIGIVCLCARTRHRPLFFALVLAMTFVLYTPSRFVFSLELGTLADRYRELVAYAMLLLLATPFAIPCEHPDTPTSTMHPNAPEPSAYASISKPSPAQRSS